jgi:hypothetical protein
LFTRKNTAVSMLRQAYRAELRVGKHTTRRALLKPSRMTVTVAGVAAVGIIAGTVGGTAPSRASASGPAAAPNHATAFTGHPASAWASAHARVDLASRATDSRPAPLAHAVKPANNPAAPAKATDTAKHDAPAKPQAAAKPKPRTPQGPTTPYQIYDSVTPTAIPNGRYVATYANGPYQASWADVSGRGDVLWIDVYGNNTGANALDVEPGDATPAVAAAWVKAKLEKDPTSKPIVYTMRSWWSAVSASINALPGWMQSRVKYWIADPTGYDHILPGADATQWYWGKSVDITSATPGFWK